MKKILFIESGIFGGGSFSSLVKHIHALDRKHIQPLVVFFNENEYVKPLEEMGIPVYCIEDPVFTKKISHPFSVFLNKLFMKGYWRISVVPYLKFLHRTSIREIIKISKEENIEGIHLNTELFRDRVGLLAGAELGIPVYSHLRSKYADSAIFYNPDYVSFANENVTKYLSVSDDTKRFWVEKVGLDSDKFEVLHDYVSVHNHNSEDFKPLPKKGLKFLCIANILPVKNHFYLVESLKNILIETDSRLLLLGKGEESYIGDLKSRIQSLGLKEYVEFLGFKANVENYIRKSDMVLLFSKSEGLPNVVLEAMSQGALMVATEVGGIPEIIENEENGFLVPLNNIVETEKLLRNVLELSESRQKEIRFNAHQTIQDKFSDSVYRKKLVQLYG